MTNEDKTAVSEILSFMTLGKKYKPFDFHLEFSLSPIKIKKALNYLSDLEIISLDSHNKCFLNNNAPEVNLLKLRSLLSHREFELKDDFIETEVCKLEVNYPYIPDENVIDKSLKLDV